MFSIHTPPIDSYVPVCLNRIAEEDDAKYTPGSSADDEKMEQEAVVVYVAEVREDAQVLRYECGSDEVDGKLVEERLGEDELVGS